MRLHDVSALTRKAILIFAAILVIFFGGRLLFGAGGALKELLNPTPPPAPTVLFGTLPEIEFSKSAKTEVFTFNINTIEGSLPSFSDQAKVYKLTTNQSNLLSLQQTRDTLANLGFTERETAIGKTVYRWDDEKEAGKSIIIDIVSKNFDMTSDFYHQTEVLLGKSPPKEETARLIVREYLSELGLAHEDLDFENANVSLFMIEGTSLIPVTSLSQAKIIRVDLFRKPIEEAPFVYPSYNQSPINFFIGSTGDKAKVVEAHVFYQSLNQDEYATYPIKTVEKAYEELKAGEGYVAKSNVQQVGIQKVRLGYYLETKPADFVLPIFIFEGDNDFVAYISAIDDSWIHHEGDQ